MDGWTDQESDFVGPCPTNVKHPIYFFILENVSCFKIPKNCLSIFIAETDTKKHGYASAFANSQGEFQTLKPHGLPCRVPLNWDSLHVRLNSHCEAWSYKKKKHK